MREMTLEEFVSKTAEFERRHPGLIPQNAKLIQYQTIKEPEVI